MPVRTGYAYRPPAPEAQGSSPQGPTYSTLTPYAYQPQVYGYVPRTTCTTGLDKHLFLSPETFLSLGIFADRLHPSAHGGRAREGQFSVWATMNKTRSRPGAVHKSL